MPTQAFEPLLNRDMSKVLPKPVINIASPVLQEIINYATNLYQRCQTSRKGSSDEAYPVLASYLHVIQMIDSIEVLVANGCGAPANLLLRSAFEGKLTIMYILERKSKNRANAWLVKNIVDQINTFENMYKSKDLSKESQHTFTVPNIIGKPSSLPELQEVVNKLKNSLAKPEYAEIYSEYKRMNKEGVKYPEWYSLYNGPRNLRALAKHLHQDDIYDHLYSSWSRISHMSDAAHLTLPLEDGTSILGPIRNPMNIIHSATFALSILIETTQAMLKEYRADEMTSFLKWYEKDVRQRHLALVNMEISHLAWFNEKFMQKG
jgi:hypothetical protein